VHFVDRISRGEKRVMLYFMLDLFKIHNSLCPCVCFGPIIRVRLLWPWFRDPLIPSFGYLSEDFRQDLATLRSDFSSRTTLNSRLDHVSQHNKINNKTINYSKP
jgi:hypothetical protein